MRPVPLLHFVFKFYIKHIIQNWIEFQKGEDFHTLIQVRSARFVTNLIPYRTYPYRALHKITLKITLVSHQTQGNVLHPLRGKTKKSLRKSLQLLLIPAPYRGKEKMKRDIYEPPSYSYGLFVSRSTRANFIDRYTHSYQHTSRVEQDPGRSTPSDPPRQDAHHQRASGDMPPTLVGGKRETTPALLRKDVIQEIKNQGFVMTLTPTEGKNDNLKCGL